MQVPIFETGNTIHFRCEYRNILDELTDPTEPSYNIYDAQGTSIASGTPTKDKTGIYYVYKTIDTEGTYIIEFSGKIANHPVKVRKIFKVKTTAI